MINEGIQIACRGVADAISEGRSLREAVVLCLGELDRGEWNFGEYSPDPSIVMTAARSHLREILRAEDVRKIAPR